MDCKIMHRNRDLWCDTHKTTSMSLLCDAAETQLRDQIVALQEQVADANAETARVEQKNDDLQEQLSGGQPDETPQPRR